MAQPGSTTNVVRTVLWIVASSLFLAFNGHRLLDARAHGVHPSPVLWAITAVWAAALLFWLGVGWRDWTRRAG